MTPLLQPLREEHAHLLPHVDDLRDVADAVGAIDVEHLRIRVRAAHEFLARHLAPHAAAEERVLYPTLDEVVGSDGATVTLRREHVDIRSLIDELGDLADRLDDNAPLDAHLAASLRRVLYGLHVLLSVHFAAEEHYVVPVLEMALTPGEADQLLRAMHESAEHGLASTGSR